jgi:hypothetical protein
MITKREYLISLGLAKDGRGRFSREGLAAIAAAEADGTVFEDSQSAKTLSSTKIVSSQSVSVPEPPLQTRVREWNLLRGTTDDGILIEWGTCSRCSEANMYCRCPQPQVPHGVTAVMLPATMVTHDERSTHVAR